MPKNFSYSSIRENIELVPEMTLLSDETLSTDIRLVGSVFDLKLSVTSEQYNRLLSAAIEGAYAAYPDDFNNVIAPLILAGKRLADTMSCEDVADCIETSEAVQTALENNNDERGTQNPNYLSPSGTENTTIINNRFPPAQRESEVKPPPEACNKDELWAGIYFMVEKLDAQCRDMLEGIVARVDKWERAAEFLGTVPIVGELAENVIGSFIDIVPDILEFYNAHSSEVVLQDVACDIFEIVCNECRYPTFDEVLSYYYNPLDGLPDYLNVSLRMMVDYLIGSSTYAAITVFYAMNAFQLWTLAAQSSWLGLRGTRWLSIWCDNGEEFANDAWEVLCDGCADVWCYQWDFTIDNGGWTLFAPYPPAGAYATGIGWQNTDVASGGYLYRGVMIKSPVWTYGTWTFSRVEIDLEYEYGFFTVHAPPSVYIAGRVYSSGNMAAWTADEMSVPSWQGDTTQSYEPSGGFTAAMDSIALEIMSSNDFTEPLNAAGSVLVKRIRFYGSGTMPDFVGGAIC